MIYFRSEFEPNQGRDPIVLVKQQQQQQQQQNTSIMS